MTTHPPPTGATRATSHASALWPRVLAMLDTPQPIGALCDALGVPRARLARRLTRFGGVIFDKPTGLWRRRTATDPPPRPPARRAPAPVEGLGDGPHLARLLALLDADPRSAAELGRLAGMERAMVARRLTRCPLVIFDRSAGLWRRRTKADPPAPARTPRPAPAPDAEFARAALGWLANHKAATTAQLLAQPFAQGTARVLRLALTTLHAEGKLSMIRKGRAHIYHTPDAEGERAALRIAAKRDPRPTRAQMEAQMAQVMGLVERDGVTTYMGAARACGLMHDAAKRRLWALVKAGKLAALRAVQGLGQRQAFAPPGQEVTLAALARSLARQVGPVEVGEVAIHAGLARAQVVADLEAHAGAWGLKLRHVQARVVVELVV